MTKGNDMERDKALAGEYALGLLPADAMAAFEARMVQEPDLRDLVADWTEGLVGMTDDISPVPVPTSVKAKIDAGLFGEAAPTSFWKRLGLWQAISGIAVTASVLMAVVLLQTTPSDDAGFLMAEVKAADSSLTMLALYDPAKGTLRLNRVNGAAVEGRDLELWLIAGDQPPKSLGVLPRDPAGVLLVSDVLQPLLAGGVLAISDEPLGGSPTGLPTGAVLATGSVVEI
jgi:anti-sigma-K factor RskA